MQLAWLGPDGLTEVGRLSAQKARYMAARLTAVDGIALAYTSAYAREFAVTLPIHPTALIGAMAARGYLAGIDLTTDYPELGNALLIALTEKRSKQEIDSYVELVEEVIVNA